MKKIKKIPTVLALIIIILGIIGGVFLVKQGPQNLFLRATEEIIPQQIKVTNITDKSFSVSWITNNKVNGFIKYGADNNLDLSANDDRDELSGQVKEYFTHHVTLKNLKPDTSYFFRVGSAGKTFDNNGQDYQTATGPNLSSPVPANDVSYGVISDQSGAPLEGIIVYLTLANAVTQSSLTKSSGNWAIPLSLARSSDLSSYVSYHPENDIIEIFGQGGPAGTTTAITTTKNDSPVPIISLGKSFDFREEQAEAVDQDNLETDNNNQFSFGELVPPLNQDQIIVINPDQGEKINTQKPEFLGKGPAGETLLITIESPKPLTSQVVVDSDGNWSWSPPTNLAPGEHTLTISLGDKKIIRSFTVLAADASNLPSYTATPSATLTPTATPTIPSQTSLPSTTSGLPSPGYLTPTLFIFSIGIGLFFTGLLLGKFFKF